MLTVGNGSIIDRLKYVTRVVQRSYSLASVNMKLFSSGSIKHNIASYLSWRFIYQNEAIVHETDVLIFFEL